MGKQVKFYIDNDVYNEAKKRINHIIDIFDNYVVCFSGGKDSLVVLSLMEEIFKERNIKNKIKVIFRDEEVIPDSVVNFVKEKYESGKYDFRYYAVPLKSEKYILGKTIEYIQWDNNRKHIRKPPEYAIQLQDNEYKVFSQYTMDEFCCKDIKGKVAMLTGIRADESLMRLQSCLTKKNENYICATESPRIKLCKPIFDWTEKDVFLYFYKNKINYCPIYDAQMYNNQNLRVATPLIANSAKCLNKIKSLYPTFYEQILDIFPEMKKQAMYYSSISKESSFDGYAHTFDGLIKYAEDTQPPEDLQRIKKMLQLAWKIRENKLKDKRNYKNLGGYSLLYLFKCVKRSGFSHIKGCPCPNNKITRQDFEFENLNIEDYEMV